MQILCDVNQFDTAVPPGNKKPCLHSNRSKTICYRLSQFSSDTVLWQSRTLMAYSFRSIIAEMYPVKGEICFLETDAFYREVQGTEECSSEDSFDLSLYPLLHAERL